MAPVMPVMPAMSSVTVVTIWSATSTVAIIARSAMASMVAAGPVAMLDLPVPAALVPARLIIDIAGAIAHPIASGPDVALSAPVPIPGGPDVAAPWRGNAFIAHGRRFNPDDEVHRCCRWRGGNAK